MRPDGFFRSQAQRLARISAWIRSEIVLFSVSATSWRMCARVNSKEANAEERVSNDVPEGACIQ